MKFIVRDVDEVNLYLYKYQKKLQVLLHEIMEMEANSGDKLGKTTRSPTKIMGRGFITVYHNKH